MVLIERGAFNEERKHSPGARAASEMTAGEIPSVRGVGAIDWFDILDLRQKYTGL
jgi:hypothetical protein